VSERFSVLAVRIVSGVFVVCGCISLSAVAISLSRGLISINDIVGALLGIVVGVGLARRSRPWRVVALVLLLLTAVAVPLGVALVLVLIPEPESAYTLTFASVPVTKIAPTGIAAIALAVSAASMLQYWALTRQTVRDLFSGIRLTSASS